MFQKVATATMIVLALFAGFASRGHAQAPGVPAQEMTPLIDKAVTFLKTAQGADGSFSPKLAGPGVTAIVAAGLLKNGISPEEPLVAKSLKYIEASVQKDGGIYNKGLANYTTAVAIMAFTEANKGGKYDALIRNAEAFIKNIQHGDDESKPSHGGFSYDGKKNPDMSNTGFSIDALVAAGVSKDDPALLKALKFVSRSQSLAGEFNDLPYAKNAEPDDKGGFTYNFLAADSRYKTPTGGLRSVGAMTYTGLKSFLYAGVSKEDPRVKAAIGWVRAHYTLEENPGMGKAGLYYYYQTFGKAMTAWGEDRFKDDKGAAHDWRRELFTALRTRQLADGSWQNVGDLTFGEGDKNLATGFALISLSYCKAR